MPWRCKHCQHLSKQDDNPKCTQRQLCEFERVAVIHYIHEAGTGITMSSGTRIVTDSIEGKEVSVRRTVPLKLCCNSARPAMLTDVLNCVTCLDCLSKFEPPDPFVHPSAGINEETQ